MFLARRKRFVEQWGNPADGTVSSARRTITQNSVLNAMTCVSLTRVPSYGKWYAEFECSDPGNFLIAVGLAKGLPLTGGNLVAMARSNATAAFMAGGVTQATQVTWTAGRVMIAIDVPNELVWMGRAGTWFSSGNPAAGTNPYYSTLPNWPWSLSAHADNDGSGVGTITLHCKQSNQAHSAPSGFLPLATG
jgi:hypothetical protein